MDNNDYENPYYRKGVSDYSTYGNAISTAGAVTTPFMPIAGLGLQAVGMGLNAYGNLKQSRQADRDYEEALIRFREEQARQQKLDFQEKQQRDFQNSIAGGQYATSQIKDIQDPYLAYARSLGR